MELAVFHVFDTDGGLFHEVFLQANMARPTDALMIIPDQYAVGHGLDTSNTRSMSIIGNDGDCVVTVDGAACPMCAVPGDGYPMKSIIIAVGGGTILRWEAATGLVCKISSYNPPTDSAPLKVCASYDGRRLYVTKGKMLNVFEL